MRYELGGMVFEPGTYDANGISYPVAEVEGWDSPTLRQQLIDLQSRHGAQFGMSLWGPRQMVMRGWADLPDDNFWLARNTIMAAAALVDSATTFKVFEPSSAGGTKECIVRLAAKARMRNHEDVHAVVFEIPLVAADPFKYGEGQAASMTGGGLLVAEGEAGVVSTTEVVWVAGDSYTFPRLRVSGPSVDPMVQIGPRRLAFRGEIPAGQFVDVSTRPRRRAMLNAQVNWIGRASWNSDEWLVLAPGENRVIFTGGGTLDMTYRGAWA